VSAQIRVLLFDVGGVLATNGWDGVARRRAADEFGFDWEEFQSRHDFVAHDFETGRLDLTGYLDRTLFYRERSFQADHFVEFMKRQTKPFADSLAIVEELAASRRYVLATLNNESRELNEHRIQKLGLAPNFSMFLSSCYLGFSKPESEIYRIAIDITQQAPDECLFIDDRPLNLECAALEGIQTIHFTGAVDLRADLVAAGVLDSPHQDSAERRR